MAGLVGGIVEAYRAKVAARAPTAAGDARPTREPDPERWGICCSGGGVRSASYCLGALQVLREEGVLQRTTYVSAVSGGSYIASAIATAATRLRPGAVPAFAPGSPEEEHLRNHSSYMAPDAAGKAQLVLRVVGGALWHLVLLCALAIVVAWPASWVYHEVSGQLAGRASGHVLNDLGMWLALAAAPLVLALLCQLEVWRADRRRPFAEWLSWKMVLLAAGLCVVLVVIPQGVLVARWLDEGSLDAEGASGLLGLVGGSAGLTAVAGALSTFVSRRRGLLLRVAAFVAGPLLVLAPVLIVVDRGAADGVPGEQGWLWWLLPFALLLGVWLRGDLTQWSLHPFYRRRLGSAFSTARRMEPGGRVVAEPVTEEMTWRELEAAQPPATTVRSGADPTSFPRLVVCAAANVTDPGATPPGRAAMPFVFSGARVGVPGDEARLADYVRGADLTVAESVAVSGAAVSPMMGKKTIRAVRFLMALMNVRLGVWMPNPARGARAPRARARPHLLFKEMLGLATLRDPYVYVTDGGHFDNLGLVELLRRGCTTVFCLDGGGDPPGSFRALGEAIALARSELQVDVEVDPTPLAPDKAHDDLARRGYALGTLRFRSSPDGRELEGDPTGRIVYCRAAVTEDSPWDVRDFAHRDRRFPFHSTMDQLFTDEKFESYRALGAHTAREAVEAWRAQALRRKVTDVLQAQARARHCIAYGELVSRVRTELNEVELPSLRPLLQQIADEEESARRPPLILLVQDHPAPAELAERLDEVYEYWQPLPGAAAALGA